MEIQNTASLDRKNMLSDPRVKYRDVFAPLVLLIHLLFSKISNIFIYKLKFKCFSKSTNL